MLPVLDGALPPMHNNILQKLLFMWSAVQGLSCFWIHTETTVELLTLQIAWFGVMMQAFASQVCPSYTTTELPSKVGDKDSKAIHPPCKHCKVDQQSPADNKQKLFLLNTYKFHALGHYLEHMTCIGTTDNYSTQLVHCF